eukprot:gene11596-24275_t
MSKSTKKQAGKKTDKPRDNDAKATELRRQQQLTAKTELRQRMEVEAKNSKVNMLKIQNQWRKIMRLAKAESLKKDIEILSQNHERDVDRKDAILQMLDRHLNRDLEEAEDQYQMALRTHLENIDELVQLHDSRLYALERSFQQELKVMQSDFEREKEIMLTKFAQEKKELSAVIDAIEQEENEREAEAKHSFEQLREEIRNRNLEEINMLRISLDAQIEELEQQFETAHLNYLQQTAQRTHDFKELTQNDQALSREIEVKRKKIDALQTSIQQWRAKTRQLNRETEERNRLLLEEKHSIQKHYQQLKQRIQGYRGTQNQRLLQLSQSANSCKHLLTEKLELARRVLHLAELCRKLETETEQVQPFAPSEADVTAVGESAPALLIHQQKNGGGTSTGIGGTLANNERPAAFTADASTANKAAPPTASQSSVWSETGSFVPPMERLWHFQRKYNRMILEDVSMQREQQRLTEENAQLEDLIAQYVEGTVVNDNVLKDDNPLFVVNGRANLNHVPKVRQIRPTVQDGIVIQNTMARQQGR